MMMMMMIVMIVVMMVVMMVMMVMMLTPPAQNTLEANTIQNQRTYKKGFLKQKEMVLMFFSAIRR